MSKPREAIKSNTRHHHNPSGLVKQSRVKQSNAKQSEAKRIKAKRSKAKQSKAKQRNEKGITLKQSHVMQIQAMGGKATYFWLHKCVKLKSIQN